MFCNKCGKEVKDTAKFCPGCGAEIKKQVSKPAPKPAPAFEGKQGKVTVLLAGLVIVAVVIVAAVFFMSINSQPHKKMSERPRTESAAATTKEMPAETSQEDLPETEAATTLTETETSSAKPHTYQSIIRDCTWNQAWQEALNTGGYLVHFDTVEEFEQVIEQLGDSNQAIKYWIGGRRISGQYEYHWMDADGSLGKDSLSGGIYSALWMENEPSFGDQGAEETYMNMFYYDKEGRWVLNDVPDDIIAVVKSYSGKVGYIVEFE